MQRWVKSSLTVAGLAPLALTCAGCLVTNELDFEANRNLPRIVRVAPPPSGWVSSQPSPACVLDGQPNSLAFEARYYDDDVDQTLYVLTLVNNAVLPTLMVREAPRDPEGSSLHVAPLICVPRDALRQNCNVVHIVVSDSLNKVSIPPPYERLLDDPELDSVTWYLGPAPSGEDGSPARPDVSFTECLPPVDGGL